ncbi:MAG: alpha/beta fold hydrolase [Luteolibacter sp.]
MKPASGPLEYLENLQPVGPPVFWHNSRGERIAWNEYGEPGGGVVMFYHGWPSSRLQPRAVHHLAREHGIRVIALERPGMGQSTLVRGGDWRTGAL